MRFRPFGGSGQTVSAISLRIEDRLDFSPAHWRDMVHAALENGINSFELAGRDPAAVDGLALGLSAVERRLLFVTLRLGPKAGGGRDFSAQGLDHSVQAFLARTGLEYLDLVLLDNPDAKALSPEALGVLKGLKASGRTGLIGVRGEDPAIEAYISTGAFDVLGSPYHLLSGHPDRYRIKTAADRDMPVIGYGYYPKAALAELAAPGQEKRGLFGFTRRVEAEATGGYAFLNHTPGWTTEELCLGFALAEPALASVQVDPVDMAHLAALAAIADRELPPGMAPRIEMARFRDQRQA